MGAARERAVVVVSVAPDLAGALVHIGEVAQPAMLDERARGEVGAFGQGVEDLHGRIAHFKRRRSHLAGGVVLPKVVEGKRRVGAYQGTLGKRCVHALPVRLARGAHQVVLAFDDAGRQHLVCAVVGVVERKREGPVASLDHLAEKRLRGLCALNVLLRGAFGGHLNRAALRALNAECAHMQLDHLGGRAPVLEGDGDCEVLPLEAVHQRRQRVVHDGVFLGGVPFVRPEPEQRRAVRDARVVLGAKVDGGTPKLREPDFHLPVNGLGHHQVVTAVIVACAARGGLPACKFAGPFVFRVGDVLEHGSVQRAACQVGLHARYPFAFHMEQAAGEEPACLVVLAAHEAVAHVAVEHDDVALAGGEHGAAVAGVGADGEPAFLGGLVKRDARFVRAPEKSREGRRSRDGERAGQQAGRRRGPAFRRRAGGTRVRALARGGACGAPRALGRRPFQLW